MSPGSQRLELRIDEALLTRIDEWRLRNGNAFSRSEAVRNLIASGIDEPEYRQFELVRAQILSAGLLPEPTSLVSDAYLYAWQYKIYPFFSDEGPHKVFNREFDISEIEMDNLTQYLDDLWLADKTPTFYEVEDHYNPLTNSASNWTRTKLLLACRYLYLFGSFDDAFWKTILTPMRHPTEASSITRAFDRRRDVWIG